jgi:hypothetical protein
MITKAAFVAVGTLAWIFGLIDNSVLIAGIGGIVAMTSSVTMIVTVMSNNRTKRMEIEAHSAHADIKAIKTATDGMNTAAVKAGVAEGKESERVRNVEAQSNFEKGKAEASKEV